MRRFWRRFQPRVLSLEPGDVLVLKCDLPLSLHQAENLKKRAQESFGWDQVVILDAGLRVEVIRKPGIEFEPLLTEGEAQGIEEKSPFRAGWRA